MAKYLIDDADIKPADGKIYVNFGISESQKMLVVPYKELLEHAIPVDADVVSKAAVMAAIEEPYQEASANGWRHITRILLALKQKVEAL